MSDLAAQPVLTETPAAPAVTETPESTEGGEELESKSGGEEGGVGAHGEKPGTEMTEADYLDDIEFERLKKKKRKMKIDNEDVEMTLEDVFKNTALNKSVTKRGQEAAEARKFAEENMKRMQDFLETAKGDPDVLWELAQRLGHDPEQLAIAKARAAYEWSKKTPEEREAIETKRERDQLKADREAREAAEAEREQDGHRAAIATEVENDLLETIKELPFRADAITGERVAQALAFLYNRDNKKPTPKETAAFVLQSLEQDVKRYIKTVSPEKLQEFLGKESVDALQEALIKQAEKNLPYAPSSGNKRQDGDLKPKAKKHEIGIDDWMNS